MGLNIVEMFIVAGAVELLDKSCPLGARAALNTTYIEHKALKVVAAGMQLAGFRYRPGLLSDPLYGHFYEGWSGVHYLQERAR